MHLRYDCMWAAIECSECRHPQTVMQELGITYQHATPISMGDQWWFWNCENVSTDLPAFLSELGLDPLDCIGCGLSKEDAHKIADFNLGCNSNA